MLFLKRTCLMVVSILLLLNSSHKISAQSNWNDQYLSELVVSDSIFSNTLQEHRKFWVQLPENYDPSGQTKYPVVFILDGDVQLNTLTAVYNNYWGHFLPHMVLVGISNRSNRIRDLTPSKITERNGGSMTMATGGAEKFTTFLKTELIPFINENYPTTNYRTLIGHSFGGLFTVNTLLNHTDLFENYIAIDPSLDWDNQKLVKQAKSKFSTGDFKGKSLFVSLAAEQLHIYDQSITIDNILQDETEFSLFGRSIVEFSNLAKQYKSNGLRSFSKVYPNDLHGTVSMPSIRDGLVTLFEWYQFKHPQKYNNPDTALGEIEVMLKQQKNILTENFGYAVPPMIEEMLIGYGYMFLQFEQLEKSFLFFNLAIEHYPTKESGYVAMADYYEAKGDKEKMIKNLQKAYDISGNDIYKNRINELRKK